jgi:porin
MKQAAVIIGTGAILIASIARAQDFSLTDEAVYRPGVGPISGADFPLASSGDSLVEPASCDSADSQIACGDCCPSLWTRPQLFGDWCGVRPGLAAHGIVADLELTQFYQGVTSGGAEQEFKYGGKMDYMFTFLGEPLGLWKGFTTILHAETRFGEAIIGQAGDLAIPNTNMLYPLPNENDTAITGLIFLQTLNERFSLVAGKINSVDFWTMFYPNVGRGVDGFMNLNSLAAGMPWLRFVQLSENAAGILAMKGQQPQGAVVVFDPQNSSTTSGLDNLFDQGAAVLGIWRFFTAWNGMPGSHLFAGGLSSRKYTALDDVSWGFIPGQGLEIVTGEETGAWSLAYYFDQVFWADPCNDARKLQLFTGASLSDGNPSFSRWNWFLSIEGFGLIHGRELDRAGVAYFYNGLSDDLRQLVGRLLPLEEVQGVEIYYNAAVTPWFRLTADLQVVDNAVEAQDTALIFGLRGKIDL